MLVAEVVVVAAAAAAAATELLLRLHVVLHVGLLDLKLIWGPYSQA